MRPHTRRSHARHAGIGVPAAVFGVLASAFTAAPATASLPVDTTGAADRAQLGAAPRALPPATAAVSDPVTASTPAPSSYTVKAGDTVSSIAAAFGLATVDVLTWNDLGWRSVIYPGQTLTLTSPATAPRKKTPSPAPATRSHTVVAGDTIFAIASRYDTTVSAILTANDLSRDSIIYPGQSIAISHKAQPAPAPAPAAEKPAPAANSGKTHIVVAGDTVFAIAQKYDTTVAAVFAANGLDAASIIYPGQKLSVAAPAAKAADASPAKTATLNAPQAENAALIIRIGRELGVSDRGIAIALATAMVESGMRNLDWGDRDSLGLFQQRPSMGWGSSEQIMDRGRSIRVFYGGPSDPNGTNSRGLLDIAGWEKKSFTDAAQSVQISAYPDRYGQWEAQAYEWLAVHG
ncbi:LysM peptidoglycan-binding domain-containing protein [Microbacterium sp.]|uniref:LysM peptidoglycan-binding domain-containing protein n=1 Tax=Microbacterium sp. TaxID=51671 RepID=UPI0026141214|nr:LysM peptidoglycan-binding domain-containing protein [Microbacterium sp.]